MDVLICFILFLMALFSALILDIPLPLALLFGYICFAIATLRRGFTPAALGKMSLRDIASSLIVLKVFLCIGILTALWRIGGTLPLLVHEGILLIQPQWFLLFAFLLSAAVSFLIGSSFGTAGTMGVGLIILAKAGGGNIPLIAGAILSGIYFGDRCAPTSSCASLVAALTGSRLYENVVGMFKSGAFACILTTFLYAVLSLFYPLPHMNQSLLNNIEQMFSLSPWGYLPALLILVLPLCKIGIKTTMLLSSLVAGLCAFFLENAPIKDILETILIGYHPTSENTFATVIQGGGILSFLNVALIIMISAAYSGIFKETNMLKSIEETLARLAQRIGLYPALLLTSAGTACVASNQTLTLILVQQLINPIWEKNQTPHPQRALQLSDSTPTLCALIPWNIACATPLAMLGAPLSAVPFSFLLYLIPLLGLWVHRNHTDKTPKNENTSVSH